MGKHDDCQLFNAPIENVGNSSTATSNLILSLKLPFGRSYVILSAAETCVLDAIILFLPDYYI